MLKKKNLIFLSLLILGVLLLSSCFLKPPVTEGILKGQVMVPEGTVQTKDLTGQALPDATVNIIDLATGDIIATTTTDANGYYQVFVPAGGPYILEAVKDGVKLQQMTCQVEVGIEYDLGIADCVTTAAAMIAQAMMDVGDNPADIDCDAIIADPNFDDVSSIVCSTIQAGQDPTVSAAVLQAIENFLNPPEPAPTPTPSPIYTVTYNGNGSTGGTVPTDANNYEQGDSVTVLGNTGNLEKTQDGISSLLFTGWNTAADGSGTSYNAADTFNMGNANVILYAQWSAITATGPAGGLIFYDKGSVSDGWRYLESAPSSTEWSGIEWGSYGTLIGGTETGIGTGKNNTTTIVTWLNNHSETGKAAQICDALTEASYSDWFLPSLGELNLMYTNLHIEGVGGFTSVYYWSSSEGGDNTAWAKSFDGGLQGKYLKNDFNNRLVRAARAFRSIAPTYLVNYNANEATAGTVPSDSYYYEPGETVTVLNNTGTLVKTGYTFDGWNTQADGGGTDRAVGSTFNMGSENITLYARWTTSVHNITQDTYYTAIQAALDAANSGDTIEVADGTYNESITFPSSKLIILQSVNGAPSTVIIGDDGSGTVICQTDTLEGTTLEGFAITHNSGESGRGISVRVSGNLAINNCTIYNNKNNINPISSYGGGIGNSGTLTITGSTIDSNLAGNGGGIINYSSGTLTITGSTIKNNSANLIGGGIWNSGTLTITESIISDNKSSVTLPGYFGGGIHNEEGLLTITGSTIKNNSSDRGGGIEIKIGTATIGGGNVSDYNIICGNTSDGACTLTNQIYPNNYPNNYFCVDCTCGFAALRDLVVSINALGIGSILEQPFDCDTTSYTATVSDIAAVYITPKANCSIETITVNGEVVNSGSISGAISLNVGINTITIIVTAKDGITTETYTVTVTRIAF